MKEVYISAEGCKFIFPNSLETFIKEVGGSSEYDFSACAELTKASFWNGSSESSIKKNLSTLPLDNKLNFLEYRRHSLVNLNFLESVNLPSLKTLVVEGWETNDIMNRTLISCEGVQYVNGLTTLKLRNSYLKDLTGLDSLTNLTTLDLQYNKLDSSSQVSNIAKCTNITELYLNNNQISTISFLSSLTALTTANLSNNSFSQIPNLSNLTSLSTLDISGCTNITDLGPLESLIKNGTTSLRTLNLQNCSGIEGVSSTTGFDNNDLIDKLRKAGCNSITTTGTRL